MPRKDVSKEEEELNPETCVDRLQGFVNELETKSAHQKQSPDEWLACLTAMAEWLRERAEDYEAEVEEMEESDEEEEEELNVDDFDDG